VSEIIDYVLEKIMNRVNSWGLRRMLYEKKSYPKLRVEMEFNDGQQEKNNHNILS